MNETFCECVYIQKHQSFDLFTLHLFNFTLATATRLFRCTLNLVPFYYFSIQCFVFRPHHKFGHDGAIMDSHPFQTKWRSTKWMLVAFPFLSFFTFENYFSFTIFSFFFFSFNLNVCSALAPSSFLMNIYEFTIDCVFRFWFYAYSFMTRTVIFINRKFSFPFFSLFCCFQSHQQRRQRSTARKANLNKFKR